MVHWTRRLRGLNGWSLGHGSSYSAVVERMTIRPPHRSPLVGTDDGEALFDSVAPRHDGVGVVVAGGAVSASFGANRNG